MKRPAILFAFICCTLIIPSCKKSNNAQYDLAAPINLKNNLLEDAYGINKDNVTFSWNFDGYSGASQKSYRIKISKSEKKHKSHQHVYDTGWVLSNKNTSVRIDNLSSFLLDDSLYCWTVSYKDTSDKVSRESDYQYFTTSNVSFKSTQGFWTSTDDDFVFARCSFDVPKYNEIEKVFLRIMGSSTEETRQYIYNVYLNDSFIGLGPTREGRTIDNKPEIYYNTFDLTNSLEKKNNTLGMFLYTTLDKSVLYQIDAYYQDGSKKTLFNSGTDYQKIYCLSGDDIMRKEDSIGTSYYVAHANNIDANKYPFGFSKSDFDYSGWLKAKPSIDLADQYVISPYYGENIIKTPTNDVFVEQRNDSIFIDLRKEIIGGFALNINSSSIKNIELHYGEQLDEFHNVKYQMITSNVYKENWKLKQGEQLLENFSMMAYRYVQIYGLNNNDSIRDAYGISYHIPFDESECSFESSNQLLNDMYELGKHTCLATTQDLFVDSYSRERAPYEGDALINQLLCFAYQDNYATSRMTLRWLLTRPTWPAEYYLLFVKMAVNDYLQTGDDSFIKEYYPYIKDKLFDKHYNETFDLITNGGETETGVYRYLIDWPENERDNYDTSVFFNTVFCSLHVEAYQNMSLIADVISNESDRDYFKARAESLKQSMIEKLYDPISGSFSDGLYDNGIKSSHYSQHATAYALYAGIYTEQDMADKMASFLDSNIKMSVYGAYFLLDGLYRSGNGHIANKLLLNNDRTIGAHSWAYILYELGATIYPEAWGESCKDNMTLSHPWSSAPVNSIVSGIFGIKPLKAGFEEYSVSLQFSDLSSASLLMPSPKGNIKVSFVISSNLKIQIMVPDNTKCYFSIPCLDKEYQYEYSGNTGTIDKSKVLLLEAGVYDITLDNVF